MTGVFNLLDYSCVSFPTGLFVDGEVDQLAGDAIPLTLKDKNIMESCECADCDRGDNKAT
jgi:hypothetical protein